MAIERYTFIASDYANVVNAFKSIGRAARESKIDVEKSFENILRAAGRSAEKTVAGEAAAQAKRVAVVERADKRIAALRERARTTEIAAHERSLAKQTAATERAATKQAAVHKREQEKRASGRGLNLYAGAGFTGAGVVGLGGRAAMGIGRVAAGVGGGLLAGGLAVGGFALRQSLQLDEQSRRIAIQGSTREKREDPTALRRHFENVAVATPGATAAGVATGTERFMAKTGDIDAAKRFGKTWAEVSLATSGSIEDIADASADLMTKFDIKTTEEMAKALSVLAVQGKRGAFELKDAAAQYPRVAAAAQRFGIGKGVGALSTLGGLTQLARSATGSPEEAATSVERMFSNMGVKAGKIKARTGVDVWKGDIKENLVNIIGKMGGTDRGAKFKGLQEVFGERGVRAISPLMQAFSDAVAQGKDGMQAMRDAISRATDATGAEAEIKMDLATAQEGAGARLTAAWETLKAAVGEQLTGAVVGLSTAFTDWIKGGGFERTKAALGILGDAASQTAEMLLLLAGGSKEKPLEEKQKDLQAEADALRAKQNEMLAGGKPLTPEQEKAYGELDVKRKEALAGVSQLKSRQKIDVLDEDLYVQQNLAAETRRGMYDPLFNPTGTRDPEADLRARFKKEHPVLTEADKQREKESQAFTAAMFGTGGAEQPKDAVAAKAQADAAAKHEAAAKSLTDAAQAIIDAAKQARPHFAFPF